MNTAASLPGSERRQVSPGGRNRDRKVKCSRADQLQPEVRCHQRVGRAVQRVIQLHRARVQSQHQRLAARVRAQRQTCLRTDAQLAAALQLQQGGSVSGRNLRAAQHMGAAAERNTEPRTLASPENTSPTAFCAWTAGAAASAKPSSNRCFFTMTIESQSRRRVIVRQSTPASVVGHKFVVSISAATANLPSPLFHPDHRAAARTLIGSVIVTSAGSVTVNSISAATLHRAHSQ